jgi:hypothetical protein
MNLSSGNAIPSAARALDSASLLDLRSGLTPETHQMQFEAIRKRFA